MSGETGWARPSGAVFSGVGAFAKPVNILPALLVIGALPIPVFVAHHSAPEVTHFSIGRHVTRFESGWSEAWRPELWRFALIRAITGLEFLRMTRLLLPWALLLRWAGLLPWALLLP